MKGKTPENRSDKFLWKPKDIKVVPEKKPKNEVKKK